MSRGLSGSSAPIASPVRLPTQPDKSLLPPVVPQPCAVKIAAAGTQHAQHRFEIPSRQRYLQAPRPFPDPCPIRRGGGGGACTRGRLERLVPKHLTDRCQQRSYLLILIFRPSFRLSVTLREASRWWPGESALTRLYNETLSKRK